MSATRTEPDAAGRPAPGAAAEQPAPTVRAAAPTAPGERQAEPRAEEPIDEPGYGHGV